MVDAPPPPPPPRRSTRRSARLQSNEQQQEESTGENDTEEQQQPLIPGLNEDDGEHAEEEHIVQQQRPPAEQHEQEDQAPPFKDPNVEFPDSLSPVALAGTEAPVAAPPEPPRAGTNRDQQPTAPPEPHAPFEDALDQHSDEIPPPPPILDYVQQPEPDHAVPPLLLRPTWTLMVRSQVRRQASAPKQQAMWHSSSIVVKILVTPTMTEERLGRCIVQASCASSVLLPDDRPAAGLFRERDGLFVPLESILDHFEEYRDDVWSLDPDSCRIWDDWSQYAQTRLSDLLRNWLIVLGVVVGAIILFSLLDDLHDFYHLSITFLWALPVNLSRVLIDVPLREMYRYGPSIVGWEGASLARICARITYHGDESFWSRNIEECERIYDAKEEATLRIARPIIYCLLIYMAYQMIKTLVTLYAERRRWKPDTDMEQTYQAFNVLIGQVGRTLAKKSAYKNG